MKIKRRDLLIGISCLIVGILASYASTRSQIGSNKSLTKRILSNAVKSMETSRTMAESCANAYNVATSCVTNLNTCDIQEESKKLDKFNIQKKRADQEINLLNQDMEKIIKEVSNKR